MNKENIFNEANSSQIPVVELLEKLGYEKIPAEEALKQRGSTYTVILKDILRKQLKKLNSYEYKAKIYSFSNTNIEQTIRDLDEPLTDGLVKTNEKIYQHLMLGRSYQEELKDGTRSSFDIKYIDWNDINNNVFHLVEQFGVEKSNGDIVRPDIVLFVNGIPFAVIECKSSSVSIAEGISQMIRNQGKDYIPQLFKFVQIVVSTNINETKYATCNTPRKFWTVWREEYTDWLNNNLKRYVKGRTYTNQDKNIISLLSKDRLLELTKYFTLFDNNIKKICRYQQYFAVKEVLKTIKTYNEEGNRVGGVIWHTQGSGKSLTMVMLAKYILSDKDIQEGKVVVVTDRVNLDKQIGNTFRGTKMKPVRATSGKHLIEILIENKAQIITTLVNKFDAASRNKIVNRDRNIFVLVDESHRTQYGELHNKMKEVFPNACYLAFTGTPLMKKEKNTMIKFGKAKPIHVYSISDAVRDGVVVPLLYEGRMVEQTVNRKAIDNRLEMITRNLDEKQKIAVMKKWSRFEKIASSSQRIELIAFDINEHFTMNYKREGMHFKGILAVNTKSEAVRYQEAFEDLGDLKTAVIMSSPDEREGYDDPDKPTEDEVVRYWNEMMSIYGSEEVYEDAVKEEFINGEELDILIVIDKLLTGFDAPIASVLYIDKALSGHNLLQAIARVNRIYEGKDYGYIIDYRGLLGKLDEAMDMYSGAGLENFEADDIRKALYDVRKIIGDLRQTHSSLLDIFKGIKNKQDPEEYQVILEDEKLRDEFYGILSKFGRNLAVALESEEVYKALEREELENYKKDLKFCQKLRATIKLRYSDDIDYKEYEGKMQKLMDNYISAEEVIIVTAPIDIMDEEGFEKELERLETPRAKADAIRTRISKTIIKKMDENPSYYKRFSERIEETLKKYKEKRISEAEYLKQMMDIKKEFTEGTWEHYYPDSIRNSESAKAFYGVIMEALEEKISYADYVIQEDGEVYNKEGIAVQLALNVKEIIENSTKVDWHTNYEVHKQIEQKLDDLLFDFSEKYSLQLHLEQIDKIIENIKTISLRRY